MLDLTLLPLFERNHVFLSTEVFRVERGFGWKTEPFFLLLHWRPWEGNSSFRAWLVPMVYIRSLFYHDLRPCLGLLPVSRMFSTPITSFSKVPVLGTQGAFFFSYLFIQAKDAKVRAL